MRRVLNVGGASKDIAIPAHYEGWEHVLLDVDARQKPDVVCDARHLASLPGELRALAFKKSPTPEQRARLKLPS